MASNYDKARALRRLDPNRWLEFDGPCFLGLQRDEKTWLREFAHVELSPTAPDEVHAMFETSRGAMVYSWFYYPLATLGLEHCFRTLELAVRLRVGDAKPKNTFETNLKLLFERGILAVPSKPRWDAARSLRNSACHPSGRDLTDPGHALSILHTTAELIGCLYPPTLAGKV